MENPNNNTWPERERRSCPNSGACLDHAGILERVYTVGKKADDLESKNFVPFSTYKWNLGLLVSILISLFSIAIFLAIDTKRELSVITSKQETTIYKITDIQQDLNDLKKTTIDDLKDLKKRFMSP